MMWKHHYFTYSTMLYYTRVTKNSAKIFTIALHFSSKVCGKPSRLDLEYISTTHTNIHAIYV